MSATPKVDVVGVGLNATDTLIPVHQFPAAGSKVEFRSANVLAGGQVATAMVACQSWGLRTRYIGKVGDDHAATLHRAEFARLGVETHLLIAPSGGAPFAAKGASFDFSWFTLGDSHPRKATHLRIMGHLHRVCTSVQL